MGSRIRWLGLGIAATALAAVASSRARLMRWGATAAEIGLVLPGDELVAAADLVATRAISVATAPDAVWPWIAQLGQGRGGFYSYDFLENVFGCDVHSAYRVNPEWQRVAVGDEVRLHPSAALEIARVDPGLALVLRGGVPVGTGGPPFDFTWAFVLRPGPAGTTRLIARERYRYLKPWSAALVEPTELVSFVMTRKMLHGIRRRAEGRTDAERPHH